MQLIMGLLRTISYIMKGWRMSRFKGDNGFASLIDLGKWTLCFFCFVVCLIFIIGCICCIEAEASMWPRYFHDRILLKGSIIWGSNLDKRATILSWRCFSKVSFPFECPRTPIIMMIEPVRHFPVFIKSCIDRIRKLSRGGSGSREFFNFSGRNNFFWFILTINALFWHLLFYKQKTICIC